MWWRRSWSCSLIFLCFYCYSYSWPRASHNIYFVLIQTFTILQWSLCLLLRIFACDVTTYDQTRVEVIPPYQKCVCIIIKAYSSLLYYSLSTRFLFCVGHTLINFFFQPMGLEVLLELEMLLVSSLTICYTVMKSLFQKLASHQPTTLYRYLSE